MRIAITTGDPNGIGIEVTIKALKTLSKKIEPILIGPKDILSQELKKENLQIEIIDPGNFTFADQKYGKLTKKAGENSVHYLKTGIELAKKGAVAALVTAPINKEALKLARIKEAGHTEIIKAETHCKSVAMLFHTKKMKLILTTIHVPLAKVPSLLTKKRLTTTIELGVKTTIQLGIDKPKIAIAGLNPHAGEHGLFGNEEAKIIEPTIKKFQTKGLNVTGPYPADTLFTKEMRSNFDLIVTHYHDQGLPPFKALYFDEAVNITCGAPIIRTSVAHGTAFAIAGKGIASPKSMIEAIKAAILLAKNK